MRENKVTKKKNICKPGISHRALALTTMVATISPASRAPRASRDASALRRRRGAGGASALRCAPRAQASDTDDAPLQFNGFDTLALHAGYTPDPEVTYGLGQGAPRGVPVYRTAPYQFKNTEHGANTNTPTGRPRGSLARALQGFGFGPIDGIPRSP